MEKLTREQAEAIKRHFSKTSIGWNKDFHHQELDFEEYIDSITMTEDEEIVNDQYKRIQAETTKRCLEKLNKPNKIEPLDPFMFYKTFRAPHEKRPLEEELAYNKEMSLKNKNKINEIIEYINRRGE